MMVPSWIRTVATAPLALSSLASRTVPVPCDVGIALRFIISTVRESMSRRSSMPILFLAEIGTATVVPPKSSVTMPYVIRSCLTLSGVDPGLSILLIATMIGTLAALQWLIASMVWGMTPSSARPRV